MKGIFTISIDYEFAWGYNDYDLHEPDLELIRHEAVNIDRLLELFEKYNIPATWAIVGHLLVKNRKDYTEYERPIHVGEKKDWFSLPTQASDPEDLAWFDANGLINKIKASKVNHEIGSHGFAHIMYGQNLLHKENAELDMRKAREVHIQNGLDFFSFIYPRNDVGAKDSLIHNGIKCYRGKTEKWYGRSRLLHFLDYFLPYAEVVKVERETNGLVNIPDSMLLIARNGLRKFIPKASMIRKAVNGLLKAEKQKKIFHLWFHPSNFSHDTDVQFEIFENVLRQAYAMRESEGIEILTMRDICNTIPR